MEFKFVKTSQTKGDTTVTFYYCAHPSNVLRYSHAKGSYKKNEEDESEEPTTFEYIGVEFTTLAEEVFNVPLKAMKRVKQTKNEEFFQVEEAVKLMRPLFQKIEDEAEVQKLLTWLEENSI